MTKPISRLYAVLGARPIPRPQQRAPPVRLPTLLPIRKISDIEARQKKRQKSDGSSEAVADPFDLSALEGGAQAAVAALRERLGRLRTSGRFDPALVEELQVRLGKRKGETAKLADVAQVIPRGGRSLTVIVGQEDHLKAVTSAITSSPHSLNPAPAPNAPLEMQIPLPAPTHESRKIDATVAARAMERAMLEVRQARDKHIKHLKAMQKARSLGPDDYRRVEKLVQGAVDKANAEVKDMMAAAKRVMQI